MHDARGTGSQVIHEHPQMQRLPELISTHGVPFAGTVLSLSKQCSHEHFAHTLSCTSFKHVFAELNAQSVLDAALQLCKTLCPAWLTHLELHQA